MKVLQKITISVLTLCQFTTAASSNDTLYLIKPILNPTTIGVSTDADERIECTEMLTEHCSNMFKTTVVAINQQGLNELKEKKHDFLIWDIEHFHFFYEDQEHIPCIQASLYRFSTSNNYQMPILAVVPPKVIGEDAYGVMAPFREGIDANLKKIKKMYKKGLSGISAIPHISAEDILNRDPLRDPSSKVFVIVSPLNDSTIGSSPTDYELFHLPSMIGHYVGELLNLQPVIIDSTRIFRIKTQAVNAKVASVELRCNDDEENEFKLSVYQAPDLETPIFSTSVNDPNQQEWKYNDEFQESLEVIFEIISKQMGTGSDKK